MNLLLEVIAVTVGVVGVVEIIIRIAGIIRRLENEQQAKDSAQNARIDQLEATVATLKDVVTQLVAKD